MILSSLMKDLKIIQTLTRYFCLKLINCLKNCYSETLPEVPHTINSYSEKQTTRETDLKNAGIFILFKKFYNFLSATDQLSRKLLF